MLPSLSLPIASSMFFTRAAALVSLSVPPSLFTRTLALVSSRPVSFSYQGSGSCFFTSFFHQGSGFGFLTYFCYMVSSLPVSTRPWSPDPGPYPALLRSSMAVSFRLWLASISFPVISPPSQSGFLVSLCLPLPRLQLWFDYPSSLSPLRWPKLWFLSRSILSLPGRYFMLPSLSLPIASSMFFTRAAALVSLSVPPSLFTFSYQGSGSGFFTSFLYLVSSLPVSTRPWSPDPGPYPALLRSSIAVSFWLWLAFISFPVISPPSQSGFLVSLCLPLPRLQLWFDCPSSLSPLRWPKLWFLSRSILSLPGRYFMLPSLSLPIASSMSLPGLRLWFPLSGFLTPSLPGPRLWSSHSLFPPMLRLWSPGILKFHA